MAKFCDGRIDCEDGSDEVYIEGDVCFVIIALLWENKIKTSLYSRYYAEACKEWRALYLRLIALGQHSYEETPRRWRVVGDAVSDLTGMEIEPVTFRANSGVFNHYANRSV